MTPRQPKSRSEASRPEADPAKAGNVSRLPLPVSGGDTAEQGPAELGKALAARERASNRTELTERQKQREAARRAERLASPERRRRATADAALLASPSQPADSLNTAANTASGPVDSPDKTFAEQAAETPAETPAEDRGEDGAAMDVAAPTDAPLSVPDQQVAEEALLEDPHLDAALGAPQADIPAPSPAPAPAARPMIEAPPRRKTRAEEREIRKLEAMPDLEFKPAVEPGRLRARHFGLIFSFLLLVVAPVAGAAWYLWERAADQYASTLGFSVQKEETGSSIPMLGGVTSLASPTTSDTDILYEYMYSQDLVAALDAEIDLRSIWSKAPDDPVFAFKAPGTIEDLTDHWARKVTVSYDSTTRIIETRVLAFDPVDAQKIATAIYAKSSAMINRLSDAARADAIRYAKEELEAAETRLKDIRTAVTAFRNRNRLVDPTADVASQSGLLARLQEQLAEAYIELDNLKLSSQDSDPRIATAERQISVIEKRIDIERQKLGNPDANATQNFADIVAEYEGLTTERLFAEETYKAALAAFDAARAEARRQGRYLAAHIQPTLSEAARYPERHALIGLVAALSFAIWSILALLYYSLRDRR